MLPSFYDVTPLLQAQVRHTIKELVARFGVCESEARMLRIRLSHGTDTSRYLPSHRKPARLWMQLCAADAALLASIENGRVTAAIVDKLRQHRRAHAVEVKTDKSALVEALRAGLATYPRCCEETLRLTLAELEQQRKRNPARRAEVTATH